MSFLRTFRSNLILSTAPPAPQGTERGTMRTSGSSSSSRDPASSANRKNSATGRSENSSGGRRSSSNSVQSRSGSKQGATGTSSARYGKENPAPIVVYLDKQKPDGRQKQPASILRTDTFTRHDEQEPPERVRNAVTRSDTFTINETNDEPVNTGTYTRSGKNPPPPATDVFEPLYAKNISLSSQEKLPTVVDSRTFRKNKTLKASKPVQKVESFIKRFERTLFHKGGNDSKRRGSSRKGSTASEATIVAGPRFRDVGINCKLDEEEKFKAKLEAIKQSRQNSRDSLNHHHHHQQQRERSLSPSKSRYFTSGTYDRRSSSSLSGGVVVQPLKEDGHGYGSGDSATPPLAAPGNRSTVYRRPTESSLLKSKQKEIEMGYSVVHKRQSGFSLPTSAPERGKRSPERAGRDALEQSASRERHYGRDTPSTARYPHTSRRDTYQTLKDEYEERRLQAHLTNNTTTPKPIGIASPRMSAVRPANSGDASPPPGARKDSQPELPKYTFGTELQQRRSRFQQFQKSFKKMDDSASEVSVQQSFFVPI